jgi:uncharacterized surface protein with fasciclin (FAS1) repeats
MPTIIGVEDRFVQYATAPALVARDSGLPRQKQRHPPGVFPAQERGTWKKIESAPFHGSKILVRFDKTSAESEKSPPTQFSFPLVRRSSQMVRGFLVALVLGLVVSPIHVQADEKDIVDTAVSVEQFSTLVAAVKAAGLVETLKGSGPFTVFAPTNAAFEKLPAGTVESLLKPENKDKLIAVLTYHVVAGKVMAKDVVGLTSAKTVQGGEIKITVDGGKVKVDDANVVKTDIVTKNGVIHVIDSVILPK